MANEVQIRRIVDGNRAFIDMPEGPENPCTACGACCVHFFRVSFYCGELTGGSGGFVPAQLARKVSDVLACMKGTEHGGRCVALVGEPGQAGIRCSIYPNRPTSCREFANWQEDGTPDPECQRLRAGIGLPPLTPIR